MPSEDSPSRHCELDGQADLRGELDERGIEHLTVNEARTFVLYREAILNLRVTDGTLSGAHSFVVECWDAPRSTTAPAPEAILAALCDEVGVASDTANR